MVEGHERSVQQPERVSSKISMFRKSSVDVRCQPLFCLCPCMPGRSHKAEAMECLARYFARGARDELHAAFRNGDVVESGTLLKVPLRVAEPRELMTGVTTDLLEFGFVRATEGDRHALDEMLDSI